MIRPLNDRVVVKRLDPEAKIGSIIVPDKHQEKAQRGEVLAVGPGARPEHGLHGAERLKLDVVVGDQIYFGKYSGGDITLDGEELVIMREDEILGVLTNEPV